MPEPAIPSPTREHRVSRNLFVEADPDLDALAQSTRGEPALTAGGRRRGRGLVVLADQHRPPHPAQAHDPDRFTRPNGNVARLRAAARHAIRQADVAAGGLLRDLAAGPYRALVTFIALALLLVAVSWLVLDVRDTSTARAAANGQLARNATMLRHQQARIEALTAELRRLARAVPPASASTAPAGRPDVRRQPTARYHRHT